MTDKAGRRMEDEQRARARLPLAAIIAGSLWLGSGVVASMVGKPAPVDVAQQRASLRAVLDQRGQGLVDALAAAATDLPSEMAGRDAAFAARARAAGFDGFALVSEGRIVAGAADAARDVVAKLQPGARVVSAPGSTPILLAARPLGEGAPMALAYLTLGPTRLADLAGSIDLPRLSHVDSVAPGVPDALDLGGAGALVWDNRERMAVEARHAAIRAVNFFSGIALALIALVGLRGGSRSAAPRDEHGMSRDPVTGLPDADSITSRIEAESRRTGRAGTAIAVHVFDIERLAAATSATELDDDVVRAFADRARGLLRGTDVLGRLEGGRFAVIQSNATTPERAQALSRRIIEAVADDAPTLRLAVSAGIALAGRDGTDAAMLVANATTAAGLARQEGRFRFAFYDRQLDAAQRARKTMEDDLRVALEREDLRLAFQPIYSADGARIMAVEALVRWLHPEKGPIPPSDFIPIAEERGLIDSLGDWVLRRACQAGRRWPDVTIAVNVSAMQFRRPGFVERVLAIVQETGFDPQRLELELTEGVVVTDADAAEKAMMELRAAGVRLALDDFGTGYSSLIYLRRFAFDKIKIDKSFLEAMETTGESAILVHSVIHLGRALGLIVVAEGVETGEQHRFLQSAGCHQLQGYLFSKPIPATELDRLFEMSPDLARRGA